MKREIHFAGWISIVIIAFWGCANPTTSKKQEDETPPSEVASEASRDSISTENIQTKPDSNWLLIPGVSAGETTIGENADSVFKRLGTPDGGDAAMQKAVGIWYSHHDTTNYSTAIYTARNTDSPPIAKVLEIRVTSPVFETKNHVHTTSTLHEIQSLYSIQIIQQYDDAGVHYTVYDSNKGIAFEMAPDSVCVAIIIPKPGVTEGTYLKFRTTNKFIRRKQ